MAGQVLLCLLLWNTLHDSTSTGGGRDTVPDREDLLRADDPEERELLLWSEEESADVEMLEYLAWVREHPFDLNRITRRQLESIPGLSGAEVDSVLAMRRGLGRFNAVEQLASIGERGEGIYGRLHPYVTVRSSRKMDRPYLDFRIRAGRQIAVPSAEDPRYLGDDRKEYGRMECSMGPLLQMGYTYAKDPGEPSKYGFLSWFIASRGLPVIDQVVVGDFAVSGGLGLVFRQAGIFGKSGPADPGNLGRESGIRPYRSVNEQNFFRGIAVESHVPGYTVAMDVAGFVSDRAISASLDDSGKISSLNSNGLFRTAGEVARLHTVRERVIGGRAVLTLFDSWSIGVSGYRALLDRVVADHGPFELVGRESGAMGIDWHVGSGLSTLYGEWARCVGGGNACVAGATLDLSRFGSLGVLVRSYSPTFNNGYSGAFREGSLTKNEVGLCIDWRLTVSARAMFSGYFDLFKYPWQSYRQPFPSSGSEYQVRCDADMPGWISLSMRASLKRTALNAEGGDSLGRSALVPGERVRWKGGANVSWGPTGRTRLDSRIELTGVVRSADGSEGRGFLLSQGFRVGLATWLDVEARLTLFDCRGPDATLGMFEGDLPGAFSLQTVNGKGRRWYMMVHVPVRKWFRLSVKYSESQRIDRESDGPGVSSIGEETAGQISAQIDVTL